MQVFVAASPLSEERLCRQVVECSASLPELSALQAVPARLAWYVVCTRHE